MKCGFLSSADALFKPGDLEVIEKESHRATIHSVQWLVEMQILMKRVKHHPITTQHDHHIRILNCCQGHVFLQFLETLQCHRAGGMNCGDLHGA